MLPPLTLLNAWLTEENQAGAPNPHQAVLATCAKDAIPHARVVALREIDERGLLFFTQLGTRKVKEITENPIATITFWFELFQREVIVEGNVSPLTAAENLQYWTGYSREAQIRFYSYAPTSSQQITSKTVLENRKLAIANEYNDKDIPLNPNYCGFRILPARFVFYAYRTDELSDVFEYRKQNDTWLKQWLSP